jgi:transcription elongation factor GreB
MSRAFVDEDAAPDSGAEVPEIKLSIPQGSRNYVTPEGAQDLSSELHRLTAEDRPRVQGNFAKLSGGSHEPDRDELAAIKLKMARLDRRIEYLDRMASLAEVIHRPESGYDRVRFGASVRVRDLEESAERVYRIVGVDESIPEQGLIGWTSPVARALTGKAPGDIATVHLPSGGRRLQIISIE